MSATTLINDKTSAQVSSATSNLLDLSAITAGMLGRATFTDPVDALQAFAAVAGRISTQPAHPKSPQELSNLMNLKDFQQELARPIPDNWRRLLN